MAGQLIDLGSGPMFIDYPDGYGKVKIGKRTYQWEFHNYLGPTFIKSNGDPLKIQPGEFHPVWPYFCKWHRKYSKRIENKSNEKN